jgi:uncharacterized membrane protein
MLSCATCGSTIDGGLCANCGAGSGGGVMQASAASPAVTENVAAMLCYFPILAVLFMLLPPYSKNKTVRFHALQCFGVVACMIVLEIVSVVVTTVVATVAPAVAGIVGMVFALASLGGLLLLVYAMVKAYRGQKLQIPFVSPLAEKFA